MTAKELINKLSALPQDAQVSFAYKGMPSFRGASEERRQIGAVRNADGRILLQGE